ncbi:MAG TPA: cation:proton antiporter, partial [Puia sp.]|nr:cation:proton antiporter [Puia sp.]
MKIARQFALYATLIIVFGGLIFYLLHSGKLLKHPSLPFVETTKSNPDGGGFFTALYKVNLQDALPRLLLQIIIIIIVTQVLGWLFKKIGQPAVIGETVAGIILGPSLLGLLFPGIFHFVFAVESLPNLRFLSQIGLILFMFIIGMELDTRLLRKQAFEALIISHASILIPFTLGVFLSYYLYH